MMYSQQMPRKFQSVKGLRDKQPVQQVEDQLPREQGVKLNMFRTWQERAQSCKKMYIPTDKIIQEVLHTDYRGFPEHSRSEKKIPPRFDL